MRKGLILLSLLLVIGSLSDHVPSCAQSPPGETLLEKSQSVPTKALEGGEEYEEEEEPVSVADPLEPFNRAMFQFNDKLYFWVVKPVAQGYGYVVPEPARAGVSRFFHHLGFPIRFLNCMLQANFNGAFTELGRFMINTLWGIGGLLDPAANDDINLHPSEEDFGRTLASYGIGHGFFIMWPILGPSSLRDTFGSVGDHFLQPVSYVRPWYAETAIKGYDKLNQASLKIGDYESLKEAAIDPYVAVRNAYIQYRAKGGGRTGFIAPAAKQKEGGKR